MPRIEIPVINIPQHGGAIALTGIAADESEGHEFVNDGKTSLLFENDSAAAITATIVSVADSYGRLGDTVIVVPAAAGGVPGKAVAGPFPPPLFNQGGGSKVNVDVSGETTFRIYASRRRD
jgi:hypothetical protein